MKKILSSSVAGFMLGITCFHNAQAQNLVTNGSFENQLNAPRGFGNVLSSQNQFVDLSDWQSYNAATPDYFASNAVVAGSNPNTTDFYRGAFTPRNYDIAKKNGTVGLFNGNDTRARPHVESIAQELPANLARNTAYYAEFYAYRANYSGAVSKLGLSIYPTTVALTNRTSDSPVPPATTMGIKSNYLTSFSWTRVSGKIVTDNIDYKRVIVGYSNPSDSPIEGTQTGKGNLPYYYIDDIALYKIPTAGTVATCVTGNTTLGSGVHIPGASYVWKVGTNTVYSSSVTPQYTVNPTTTTTYSLTVTLPDGNTHTTSVTVSPCPPCPDASATTVHQTNTGCNETQCTYVFETLIPPTGWSEWIFIDGAGNVISSKNARTLTLSKYTNTVYLRFYAPVDKISNSIQCDDIIRQVDLYQQGEPIPLIGKMSYPNPVANILTIPIEADRVFLLNDKGKVVMQNNGSRTSSLDIHSLPQGLYILQVWHNNKITTQRIEIKR